MRKQKLRYRQTDRLQHTEPLRFILELRLGKVHASGTAQNHIDKAGGTAFAKGTSQLNGFVHRSRIRHRLHIAHLIKPAAQNGAHGAVQLLHAAF